ncbi:unnamed protein product [Clonostachys byssicola]|uniref:Nucleoside phosphorylase domain-containing protein n=1 Tax=Clonostachys byssicola TaxID=160290 RepID=A0A9N9XY85_9HYPO|nr:unnamed protein product [Clonostachys byssicola]
MNNTYIAPEGRRKRPRERDDDAGLGQGCNNSRHRTDDVPNAIGASSASLRKRKLEYKDYTVAWICALPKERAAATAMLDCRHDGLPRLPGDTNSYSFGNIGQHNVVITCLPSGHYGTVNAAVVANNLARSFPKIIFRLMVGIGGGVPNIPSIDIRLGDVVVGHNVLQYDLGKTTQGGEFHCTSDPVKPPPEMLTAVSDLRASHEYEQSQIPAILLDVYSRVPGMKQYQNPVNCLDRLFDSTYEHALNIENCDQCDQSRLIERLPRASTAPQIHYGTIASGNRVMKHAESRDNWAEKGCLCFEMEAAGLIDNFPCLVIRGICDYCDSHKSKEWQEYAATTAAAYAKELLLVIQPTSEPGLEGGSPTPVELDKEPVSDRELRVKLEKLYNSLEFDQMDDRFQQIKRPHLRTCNWLLGTDKYSAWMEPGKIRQHGGFLWIKGKPGSGKSTMMKFIFESSWKQRRDQAILSFFFNARGHDLEKSTAGLYRSILFQLLNHDPELKLILKSHLQHFSREPRPKWTDELLKELIEEAIERLTSSVVCFIDALDECQDEEVRDMVAFFERLGELAIANGVGLLVCFSSRHYPHITLREGIGLHINLDEQEDHDVDIAEYIDFELRIGHSNLAQDIKNEVREKASGVFMWTVLVVNILNRERGRMHALRQKLREIPQSLNDLFFDILSRGSGDEDETLLCFQLILFAQQPLTPQELHHAILSQAEDNNLEPIDLSEEDSRIFLIECSKGLSETIGHSRCTVQFIHESVKDFLLQGDRLYNLWPKLGSNPIGNSHLRLRDVCLKCLSSNTGQGIISLAITNRELAGAISPFLKYAAESVLFHAEAAASFGIQQPEFISIFPTQQWILLNKEKDRQPYPDDTRGLYILVIKDTPNLLASYPSILDCFEIRSERCGCPLLAAIIHERRNILQVVRNRLAASTTFPEIDLSSFEQTEFKWVPRPAFNFSSSKRSLVSYLAEYGDPIFLITAIQQDSEDPASHQNFSSDDAIYKAVAEGHETALRVLLHYGKGDINFSNVIGQNPLSRAILGGQNKTIKLLLATGKADLGLRDHSGQTPLSWAATTGQTEAIKLLLETGQAGPGLRDDYGQTPLSRAAIGGQTEAIKLLLATGQAGPDLRDDYGQTPLTRAAIGGQTEAIKLLLETDQVAPDSKDNFGRTPLSFAAERGCIEIIELLLATGQVDPHSIDDYGQTPLSWAERSGSVEATERLSSNRLNRP